MPHLLVRPYTSPSNERSMPGILQRRGGAARRCSASVGGILFALIASGTPAGAQSDLVLQLRDYRESHEHEIVGELVRFLSVPNVADDSANIGRNADLLVEMLELRGVTARRLEVDGPPYVFGQLDVPGASRTVLFYCHYDGQPVDPTAWVGHSPWEPVLRDGALDEGGAIIAFPRSGGFDPDWRIYARSASDDKAPIVGLLAALDALASEDLEPRANLKFLFEGDEEAGSPNLRELIGRHGDLLTADLVVAADGPIDPSGRPTLFFGVRGIVTAEITVYGPARPLHSGHYGNWAPNPGMNLAQLLASMKNPATGRVRIDGFYDDVIPLGPVERRAIAEIPDDDEEQRREFAFGAPEMEGRRLELINLPSLNVRGLRSGWVGTEARTIVPDRAIAALDLRLVKDISPDDQIARLREHIRSQGYHVVEDEPDLETRLRHARLARVVVSDGYPAFRTPMDLPIAMALIRAVESHTGERAVKYPTLGGSVPLYVFTDVLGVPTVGVPIVNHDNNQHSPNENLRLGHFWAGIETLGAVMMLDGAARTP